MNAAAAETERLSAFQAAMLRILHAGGSAESMRADLQRAAADAGLADYVAGFDDRMLIVASELVRKWGARSH